MKRKKVAKKKEWFDEITDEDIDKAGERLKEREKELSDDNGAPWANMLWAFKKYIYEHPGMTRFELARDCEINNDLDFRKTISYLKFTGEIYEDDGFFYARNRDSLYF